MGPKKPKERVKITKRAADGLKPGEQIFDATVRGFGARALPSGRVSFFLKYVDRATGKQRLLTLGQHGSVTVEMARDLAEEMRGKVAKGEDPADERRIEKLNRGKATTVSELLDEFLERYVNKRELRSADEYKRIFNGDVKPAIGNIALKALRRSDIVRLLDKIEDRGSPVMADRVLAHLRAALNWHATRDDQFIPPIVKGMARRQGNSRTRVLTDAEIRALWSAADKAEPRVFGALLKFLLFTAARRDEAARATWDEIDAKGLWVVPEERYKTGITHDLPLPIVAQELIGELPKLGTYIFTTGGKKPFSGFSKSKADLDTRMLEKLKKHDPKAHLDPWRIHDLRRTARSLMSRAGVQPDIAERVLGHAIPGVRGVYDRHAYVEEKREALKSLSAVIMKIVKKKEPKR